MDYGSQGPRVHDGKRETFEEAVVFEIIRSYFVTSDVRHMWIPTCRITDKVGIKNDSFTIPSVLRGEDGKPHRHDK